MDEIKFTVFRLIIVRRVGERGRVRERERKREEEGEEKGKRGEIFFKK